MGTNGSWRSLVTWWPWSAPPECEQQESAPLPERESHQRRLNRLLTRGVPTWSEPPPAVITGRRRLLIGERALILRRGDELLLSCPLCEERLLAEGCFHVTPGSAEGTPEDGGGSLQVGTPRVSRRLRRRWCDSRSGSGALSCCSHSGGADHDHQVTRLLQLPLAPIDHDSLSLVSSTIRCRWLRAFKHRAVRLREGD